MSPLGFVAEGRSLIGSYLGSAVPSRDIPRFVELWRDGRLPVESLVSSTIALDGINAGMDELAEFTAVLLDGRTRFQTGQFFSFSGGWSP